jgi:hypothetical protein
MGLRALIGIGSLAFVFAFVGCSKNEAQKVAPETQGKRGERCQARNDCATGLACLNNICAKNEFAIDVAAKHCDRIECEETADCCGDRRTEAPEACKGRDTICSQPNLPGCVTTSCVSEDTCGGAPCMGTCVGSGQAGTLCETAADCPVVANTCVGATPELAGSCSYTGLSCTTEVPCAPLTATCSAKSCRCQNPAYNPTAPICTDPDCEDICLLRCDEESQLCLEDTSCKTDTECLNIGLKICEDGRCVECVDNEECDEDNGETCKNGACEKPCEVNEECPLFNECDAGECKYVGCHSDRECILAASRGTAEGETPQPTTSNGDDPRMFQCLPSDTEEGVRVCKIPCENDGSCGQFQVCDDGFCKFVGCENDEECRGYLGLTNQMTSETKPYVARAICRE